MDYRGVLLVAMVSGAALVGATSACSGPDPGQITFSERPKGTTDITSGGSGQILDGGDPDGGGGTDASKEGGSSSGDPVFGTTTFALGALGRGAPAKGNPNHAAFTMSNPAGQDCITCHAGDWAFAGTLFTDKASTTPVAGAEIRVAKPDGTLFASAYSDADGNFWIETQSTAIPNGSRVGVRNGTLKESMVGTIGAGQAGCSQGTTCHGGTQGKVYLK